MPKGGDVDPLKNHDAKRHSRNSNILQCHFLYCDIFFPRSPTMPVVSSFLFTVTWLVIFSSNGNRPVYQRRMDIKTVETQCGTMTEMQA
ncbi:hypothetical protein TNCV_2271661 [Trichonephila clavipes]|nr:hypothetical protein TNCV_2271661 [Trichonephila clavipes]